MSIIGDAYLRALAIQAHMFGQVLRGEQASFPSFERPELVSTDLPDHLREDAPFAVCDRCQRHTWTLSEFGQEDRMTQPDGYPCGGRFSDPRAPLTSRDPEPPEGTEVVDSLDRRWTRDYRGYWLQTEHPDYDPESWTKVAGNYGPVRIVGYTP